MKSEALKMIKKFMLSVVSLAIVAVGTLNTTIGTSAAEIVKTETSGVIYVQYSNMDHNEYWGTKAPEYIGVDGNGIGYLFGGWYAKNGDSYTPIETEDALNTASESGTVVAKFVPAQTMSVKCQNWAGTNKESNEVIVRVISATDSKNYRGFGFEVSKIVNGTESKFDPFNTETVYRTFNYYESAEDNEPDPYVPSDLFGKAAQYFTTCTVGKIPTNHHGTIICIKPYWKTLDGVTVYGLSKYAHVEDGYLGYVNVPVNLNVLTAGTGAAAGILSVKSDNNLTFIGAEKGIEVGKVFDEIGFNVLSDGTIKCVGNTSDASDKTGMDVYINLKFQRNETTDAPTKGIFYTFTVGDEDFANSNEDDLTNEDVWNVIY